MAALSDGDRAKPEGWFLDVAPTDPPRLLGGERNLVILGAAAAVLFGFQVGPHVSGSVLGLPPFVVVAACSLGFYFLWSAVVNVSWRIDPWMSRSLPRFMSYPKFIPAHACGASSPGKRYTERQRSHLKR